MDKLKDEIVDRYTFEIPYSQADDSSSAELIDVLTSMSGVLRADVRSVDEVVEEGETRMRAYVDVRSESLWLAPLAIDIDARLEGWRLVHSS